MTPGRVLASALAAVVAISGIGGILLAQHQPGAVDAVELRTDRDAPAPAAPELNDPAIRRDDDVNGLQALDDDDRDDSSDDSLTGDSVSAASVSAADSSVSAADSSVSVANTPAPARATPAPAPAASAASAASFSSSFSSNSGSSDSDD